MVKLKWSTPVDTMIIVTMDNIHYNYFSSNTYGGVYKAKEAARLYLKEKKNENRHDPYP